LVLQRGLPANRDSEKCCPAVPHGENSAVHANAAELKQFPPPTAGATIGNLVQSMSTLLSKSL
jgi:hypothetical protein